jgi:hypothetical protein
MEPALFSLPAIFIVLGVALFVLGQFQRRKAMRVESWPTTPGVILSSELHERSSTDEDGSTSVSYQPVIEFSYRIMGLEYTSSQYRMGSRGTSYHRKKAESITNHYPVGQQVDVRYDPEKPTEAVLELGSASAPILMIIGGAFAILGIIMLVVFLAS